MTVGGSHIPTSDAKTVAKRKRALAQRYVLQALQLSIDKWTDAIAVRHAIWQMFLLLRRHLSFERIADSKVTTCWRFLSFDGPKLRERCIAVQMVMPCNQRPCQGFFSNAHIASPIHNFSKSRKSRYSQQLASPNSIARV